VGLHDSTVVHKPVTPPGVTGFFMCEIIIVLSLPQFI
jgi:hypothetical protein